MLSMPHLVIIFLVALLVFGPEKLPELARTFGKAMAEFRRATGDLRAGFEEHMRELERETRISEAAKQQANPPPRQPAAETATQAGTLPETPAINEKPDAALPESAQNVLPVAEAENLGLSPSAAPESGTSSHSPYPSGHETVPEKASDGHA
ncbi:MAG: Sec-independent protein translocase subunit TatA/TatB [Candidatus Acidiferrales bacterium]